MCIVFLLNAFNTRHITVSNYVSKTTWKFHLGSLKTKSASLDLTVVNFERTTNLFHENFRPLTFRSQTQKLKSPKSLLYICLLKEYNKIKSSKSGGNYTLPSPFQNFKFKTKITFYSCKFELTINLFHENFRPLTFRSQTQN